MLQALIFANGDMADGLMVRRSIAVAHNPLIVAADGGARVAQFYGLFPQLVIGDMDSLSQAEQSEFESAGTILQRFPPEKDETDLELALYHVIRKGIRWIRIIGGIGDRFDQSLANIYLMGLPELQGHDVQMVAGKQSIRLIYPGRHQIDGEPDDTISLIPIGGNVQGVRTENLKYPLRNETLRFGPARGVSNVMETHQAFVTLKTGILLLVHTVGRA